MRLNDDFTAAVVVETDRLPWVPSPAPGVERRMLFRIGGEVARATSIVRYAPMSRFPRHAHGGGEEILVLDGVFQDEHGDYPAGSYFRNPPGTAHVPASVGGCTIFVRLWQFRASDRMPLVWRPAPATEPAPPLGAVPLTVLHDDRFERVSLAEWPAATAVAVDNPRGLEFLVIGGRLDHGDAALAPSAWGRLPAGRALIGRSGPDGARLWLKDAPPLHPDVCALPAAG